ncbi:hypothetical protein BaRGS_00014807 [Batillaria attramentaria]|uniref:Uncharacterized protein n=1 Tax=Batillaria attramentaria TaxID=370345 RepID=A0ABD0L371_9CAEN
MSVTSNKQTISPLVPTSHPARAVNSSDNRCSGSATLDTIIACQSGRLSPRDLIGIRREKQTRAPRRCLLPCLDYTHKANAWLPSSRPRTCTRNSQPSKRLSNYKRLI